MGDALPGKGVPQVLPPLSRPASIQRSTATFTSYSVSSSVPHKAARSSALKSKKTIYHAIDSLIADSIDGCYHEVQPGLRAIRDVKNIER